VESGRAKPRVLRSRAIRDGLVLLASVSIMIAALAAGRRRRAGDVPEAAGSNAPLLLRPSPLPSGAEQQAIAVPDEDISSGCDFADRGFGSHGQWRSLPNGRALIPPGGTKDAAGQYDLLVHFHGAEPVRKELAPLDLGLVIAAVDAGTRSSHYDRAMQGGAWEELLASIDRAVEEISGIAGARPRRVALSSWSAGSGAVTRILSRSGTRLDALILLDSLYAGYATGRPVLVAGQLAPFVSMADAAARGGPLFYLTHTAVPTTGYASTGEAATFLLQEVGARAIDIAPSDGDPRPLTRMYDGGNLYVRGYAGATREAHCDQLRLLPAILAEHILPAFGR
jgi:hypothetical protein